MLVDQVRLEILRFSDPLAHLQNPKIQLFELVKVLEIIGTLPAFYIGIRHARWVTVSQLIGQVQHRDVETFPVFEQGGPGEAGE